MGAGATAVAAAQRGAAMRITDAFLGEHGAFKAMFARIEKLAEISGDLAQIESTMAVLETEIEAHAALEEDMLFPMLEKQPAYEELVAKMRAQHKEIFRAWDRIESARDVAEALELVTQAVEVAREHFETEESTFYPTVRRVLSEDQLNQLAETWAVARHVRID